MANSRWFLVPLLAALLSGSGGCASLTNPLADAMPVRAAPDYLLAPSKDDEVTIPLTVLSLPADTVYRVAPGDVLGIWIEGILGAANQPPPLHVSVAPVLRDQRRSTASVGYPVPVDPEGTITLPLVGSIPVTGKTMSEIQKALVAAYTPRFLKAGNERILVTLLQPRQVRVLVLRQESQVFTTSLDGQVVPAGKRGTGQIVELGANENDILHALTLSGGLPSLDVYNKVIVFRNGFRNEVSARALLETFKDQGKPCMMPPPAASIPLRMKCGHPPLLPPELISLQEGDVVFLEARDREIFFTGGLLPAGEHILPRDRSLDVLEAVARVRGPLLNGEFGTNNLAGNLVAPGIGNPSPSLLVVIRKLPGGGQIPIRVDLNRALTDARERLVLQHGDFVLLQEHPTEALTRYFSTSFINWQLTWQAIRTSTGAGVLDVGVPQNIPGRVGINFDQR